MNLLSELSKYVTQSCRRRCCKRKIVHSAEQDDASRRASWIKQEGSAGDTKTPGKSATDGGKEVQLPTAVEAENNASVSDLILAEWYDSLKQNEEDMEHVQADVESMS